MIRRTLVRLGVVGSVVLASPLRPCHAGLPPASAAPAPVAPGASKLIKLDQDAIRAWRGYMAARASRKSRKAAAKKVVTAEEKLNVALRAWTKAGVADSCTTAAARTHGLIEVTERVGIYFRRAAGWLHTDVPDLDTAPACAGDLTLDRLVAGYFERAANDDLAGAVALLERIDQQLLCQSVSLVHRTSMVLREALDVTHAETKKHGGRCAVASLGTLDEIALNLVYRTFERSLPYGKSQLDWMDARKTQFLTRLADPSSVLSRQRLWIGQRAAPELIGQLPAACRTGSDGRPQMFLGPNGESTCDPLAAMIRSLGGKNFGLGDCYGGDLQGLPAAGGPISQLACQKSCQSLPALGWTGHPGGLAASALGPLTASLQSSLARTGLTPLGASAGDVQGQCASFGSGAGAGIGPPVTAASTAACVMGAQSTMATRGSLLACAMHGLVTGARSQPTVPNLRSCTAGIGKDDEPEPPKDRQPPPPKGEGSPANPGLGRALTAPAVEHGLGRALTPPSLVDRFIQEGSRDILGSAEEESSPAPTGESRVAVEFLDGTHYSSGNGDAEAEGGGGLLFCFGGPCPSPSESPRRGPMDDLCSTDGSCPTSCTGTDRFTQIFQVCAEQQSHRAIALPTNTDRPGSTDQRGAALTACLAGTPSALPHTCPTMSCPADFVATMGADGRCSCAPGGAAGGGASAQNSHACDTVRCAPGTIPTVVGPRCVCQSQPGSGATSVPAPHGPSASVPGLSQPGPVVSAPGVSRPAAVPIVPAIPHRP